MKEDTNTGTKTYGYDNTYQLTAAEYEKNQQSFTWTYDNTGIRLSSTEHRTKNTEQSFLPFAETDSAGKIQKVYINDGQGIVGMVRYIYKEDSTLSHYQPLYYMFDSLGSVSLITSEDGKPLQNYKYTPYGKVMNAETDTVNSLRFVGRYGGYQDDDTNLTYFWHRWYDGGEGRWVSREPIKFIMEYSIQNNSQSPTTCPFFNMKDIILIESNEFQNNTINLYQYGGNNSVVRIDVNGQWWQYVGAAALIYGVYQVGNYLYNVYECFNWAAKASKRARCFNALTEDERFNLLRQTQEWKNVLKYCGAAGMNYSLPGGNIKPCCK